MQLLCFQNKIQPWGGSVSLKNYQGKISDFFRWTLSLKPSNWDYSPSTATFLAACADSDVDLFRVCFSYSKNVLAKGTIFTFGWWIFFVGGAAASWVVGSSSDREVRPRAQGSVSPRSRNVSAPGKSKQNLKLYDYRSELLCSYTSQFVDTD